MDNMENDNMKNNNMKNNNISYFNIVDRVALVAAVSKYDDFIIHHYKVNRGFTRFASNTITQNLFQDNENIYITAYRNKKKITLSTNDSSDSGINELIKRTDDMLEYSVEDLEYVPSYDDSCNSNDDNNNNSNNNNQNDNNHRERNESLRFKMVDSAITRVKNSKYVVSGVAENAFLNYITITKNGARRFFVNTFAEYSNTLECNGERAAARESSVDINNINYSQVYERAHQDLNTILKKGKRSFTAGRYDVLLSSRATADLMGSLFSYGADRRSYDEGHSAFKGKIDTKIADSTVSIYTDPNNPQLPSMPFTSDGRPIKKHYFIKEGFLCDLPTSPFWAKKNNLQEWCVGNVIWDDTNANTSNSINGGIFSDGFDNSEKDLLKKLKKGFYIKEFWYIRMVRKNDFTLTGMTRNGIFYVEDGEIVSASNHFRWNESPISILSRISGFSKGSERRSFYGGASYYPALLIKDFYLSSKTEF